LDEEIENMKQFLKVFEESATSRIFDKENAILLFESKNDNDDVVELHSGWKRTLHFKTRPEQLGLDWLAGKKFSNQVPVNITVETTPDRETLFNLSYYELYKEYLLLLAKKRGFGTGRILSKVNGGFTVGLSGHTMFLPNKQSSRKLFRKKTLFSFLSYNSTYGSFVVSQKTAYRKVYKIWTKRLKRIKK